MAELSDGARAETSAEYMRENKDPVNCAKADIRAAINALDDFFEANGAAINAAIPQPARSGLSTNQKIRLAMFVLRRRIRDGSDG